MACCKACCGCADCAEGDQGKCCCGGSGGECCLEGEYCCDGVCQEGPCEEECPEGEVCYICCCCDNGESVSCYSLDYAAGATTNRDDCVTGVESPVFGDLFGDWANCTFSYTEGECEAEPP